MTKYGLILILINQQNLNKEQQLFIFVQVMIIKMKQIIKYLKIHGLLIHLQLLVEKVIQIVVDLVLTLLENLIVLCLYYQNMLVIGIIYCSLDGLHQNQLNKVIKHIVLERLVHYGHILYQIDKVNIKIQQEEVFIIIIMTNLKNYIHLKLVIEIKISLLIKLDFLLIDQIM